MIVRALEEGKTATDLLTLLDVWERENLVPLATARSVDDALFVLQLVGAVESAGADDIGVMVGAEAGDSVGEGGKNAVNNELAGSVLLKLTAFDVS